jgi:hypothetical protein
MMETLESSFITLMMEAVHISETSVYFNDTSRRYIPENFHLHETLRSGQLPPKFKQRIDGNLEIFECIVPEIEIVLPSVDEQK